MKRKYITSAVLVVAVVMLACIGFGQAHSGGTDSCGGHHVTATGEYHVHNWSKWYACYPQQAPAESDYQPTTTSTTTSTYSSTSGNSTVISYSSASSKLTITDSQTHSTWDESKRLSYSRTGKCDGIGCWSSVPAA